MARILYISYDGINEKLARSQILPYLKGLSACGNEVILLSYVKNNVSRAFIEDIRKEFGLKQVYNLKYHKKPKLFAALLDVVSGVLKGSYIIIKYRIDLVHARSYISCSIAKILKGFFGKPYIFDIRGFLGEERLDSGDWSDTSFSYRVTKTVERGLFRNADFTVTLTDKAKNIVTRDFGVAPARIEVIPTCVDLDLFGMNKEKTKIYDLVYFGSLGTWYMLGQMLDFFAVYLSIKPQAKLLFLTDASANMISDEAIKRGVPAKNFDIKFVKHEMLSEELSACKFSIFFIKACYSKVASCPTKLGESLASGIPALTNSGIGDVDEIVGASGVGVIIKEFNREEYIKAIEKLDSLYSSEGIARRCRITAEKYFSLKDAVAKYNDIYKRLVHSTV